MTRNNAIPKWFMLFLAASALRQAAVFAGTADESLGWLPALVSPIVLILALVFIISEHARFREYGLQAPKRSNRLVAVSLFLGAVYVLIVLFVPGGMSGFEALPGAPLSWELLWESAYLVLFAVTTETVFRGYIQSRVDKTLGFGVSVVIVTLTSTIFVVPVTTYFSLNTTMILQKLLPSLAQSVFLVYFFRETKTLLSTIGFSATVALLQRFTPLEAIANQYVVPITVVTYIVFLPVMQSLVGEIGLEQEEFDRVPILEEEE